MFSANCVSNNISSKCLLNTYYLWSTILDACHIEINKTGMDLALLELKIEWEKQK